MKYLVLLLLPLLVACEERYRYPCQDPENWGKSECKPPVCEVDGNCTKTLLGWDPTETTIQTNPAQETVTP